jgi:hypothetical protein
MPRPAAIYGAGLALVVFLLGILFDGLLDASARGATPFQQKPTRPVVSQAQTEAGGR